MEDNADLKSLFLEISNKEQFNSYLLEKDYYLTKFLIKLSKNPIDHLVFKGGTCLNKCYLGFYRLSEDIDFIYNKDLTKITKRQLKIKTEEIRQKINFLLKKCGFEVDNKLGHGWTKVNINNRVVSFTIYAKYYSLVLERKQKIVIDVSFRNKLFLDTSLKEIKHLFYDKLNNPLLDEKIKIECISLKENLAEKYRALITRKDIAIRDVFDIFYILQNTDLKQDLILRKLIIQKVQETKKISEKKIIESILKLNFSKIDVTPLEIVLRDDVPIKKIINKWDVIKEI
jgi:predicted nucleotidyltransferase component of viral defense system